MFKSQFRNRMSKWTTFNCKIISWLKIVSLLLLYRKPNWLTYLFKWNLLTKNTQKCLFLYFPKNRRQTDTKTKFIFLIWKLYFIVCGIITPYATLKMSKQRHFCSNLPKPKFQMAKFWPLLFIFAHFKLGFNQSRIADRSWGTPSSQRPTEILTGIALRSDLLTISTFRRQSHQKIQTRSTTLLWKCALWLV